LKEWKISRKSPPVPRPKNLALYPAAKRHGLTAAQARERARRDYKIFKESRRRAKRAMESEWWDGEWPRE